MEERHLELTINATSWCRMKMSDKFLLPRAHTNLIKEVQGGNTHEIHTINFPKNLKSAILMMIKAANERNENGLRFF